MRVVCCGVGGMILMFTAGTSWGAGTGAVGEALAKHKLHTVQGTKSQHK